MQVVTLSATSQIQRAFQIFEGRGKLAVIFHLHGGKVLRFSQLHRVMPGISQKMLIQQLRRLEEDGIVQRIVHHQVPPKVEYGLTEGGQALSPAVEALLEWAIRFDHTLSGDDAAMLPD